MPTTPGHLLACIKRRSVFHYSDRHLAGKGQGLEVFGGNAGQLKAGVGFKAEAAIITGVAQHDATGSAQVPQLFECGLHQCRANALALTVRPYADRSQTIPTGYPG